LFFIPLIYINKVTSLIYNTFIRLYQLHSVKL